MLRTTVLFICCLPLALSLACAEEGHPQVSGVSFETSADDEAEAAFREGVRLLHLFEYPRARARFVEARRLAPDFALAAWGEAMTHVRLLWGEEDLDAARAALSSLAATVEARRAKAPTPREKAWLATIEALVGEGEQTARLRAFERAFAALAEDHPEDVEAAAFHALAMLGTAQGVRHRPTYDRAAGYLKPWFAKHPEHPGVTHYLVHCYDDPEHAHLAVDAAHGLMRAAPDSSHALHMASHIYLPLGRWRDVIQSNEAAWRVSGEHNHHALQWLAYARLQIGDRKGALAALDIMESHAQRIGTPKARLYLVLMRAAQLVDGGTCDEAVRGIDVDLAGLRLEFFAEHHLADALCAWRAEQPEAIATARSALEQAIDAMATAPDTRPMRYSKGVAGVALESITALGEAAAGDAEQAMKRLRAASERQAAMPREFGPPAPAKPALELLGDILHGAGKHAEAIDAYRRALERHPGRRAALLGMQAAAEAAGDQRALAWAAERIPD